MCARPHGGEATTLNRGRRFWYTSGFTAWLDGYGSNHRIFGIIRGQAMTDALKKLNNDITPIESWLPQDHRGVPNTMDRAGPRVGDRGTVQRGIGRSRCSRPPADWCSRRT